MMSSIRIEQDSAAIVHLILDKPNASINLMDSAFFDDYVAAINQLKQMEFSGVVLRSTKSSFFAGGDLDELRQIDQTKGDDLFKRLSRLKEAMRWLEACDKPIVACINGAALGGGWELALACHHRIALDKEVTLGLPEVTLGLLPGAGGVVRMTRYLGLKKAMAYLVEGKRFSADEGVDLGLINQLAASPEEMLSQATDWILAQPLPAMQTFDKEDFQLPGGGLSDIGVAELVAITPAMLKQKTQGMLPAPEAILAVMVESTQVDVASALRIESRYFVSLAIGQVSTNMITTFWHQLNEINAGASRPQSPPERVFTKVGIVGAGMMGAGIAYSMASRGIRVVLKDMNITKAIFAKSYTANILAEKVARGKLTAAKQETILQRIVPSDTMTDLVGCELIIEAVFEDRVLKSQVTKEVLDAVGDDVIIASNTSTLPITGLAAVSTKAENYIGLHFFSPVDKMPLVEIIKGGHTSDVTLSAAYDLVMQIGKVPIVVNDSRGFFTSRVFTTYTQEGMRMLHEGIPAAVIENGAIQAGFRVGPLAIIDEVSLTLLEKVRRQTQIDLKAEGKICPGNVSDYVMDEMLAAGRIGKLAGSGFYDYPDEGNKSLWPGLAELFPVHNKWDIETVKDRLLFVQSLESIRAYEEGVVTSARDANIGSIMGLGFPAWTGGVIQFVEHLGDAAFARRAQQLCDQFGTQFSVPELLKQWAAKA
jgi:3-hydroxyacyl-CoA dehydrogenase/enoyl-CoA hydratase/3-hydroxybutyryl-CoA epimerase